MLRLAVPSFVLLRRTVCAPFQYRRYASAALDVSALDAENADELLDKALGRTSVGGFSGRIAKLMVALARESYDPVKLGHELRSFQEISRTEPAVKALCEDNLFTQEAVENVCQTISAEGDLLQSVIQFCNDNQKLQNIDKIIEDYHTVLRELSPIRVANVITAAALSNEELNKLKYELKKSYLKAGQELELKVTVDPSLYKGVKVELDGHIIDSSFSSYLEDALSKARDAVAHVDVASQILQPLTAHSKYGEAIRQFLKNPPTADSIAADLRANPSEGNKLKALAARIFTKTIFPKV